MDLNNLITMLSVMGGWSIFTEWRIRNVETRMLEKMKDREDISNVKIEELKANVLRMEAKLDTLIGLLYRSTRDYKNGKN